MMRVNSCDIKATGRMRTLSWSFLIIAVSLLIAQDKSAKTLYERVGRYEGIAAIVDAYLKGMRADPQLARFIGRGTDSLAKAKQLLKDQLCAMTGGPCASSAGTWPPLTEACTSRNPTGRSISNT